MSELENKLQEKGHLHPIAGFFLCESCKALTAKIGRSLRNPSPREKLDGEQCYCGRGIKLQQEPLSLSPLWNRSLNLWGDLLLEQLVKTLQLENRTREIYLWLRGREVLEVPKGPTY